MPRGFPCRPFAVLRSDLDAAGSMRQVRCNSRSLEGNEMAASSRLQIIAITIVVQMLRATAFAQGTTECERETVSVLSSPDDDWVALVREDLCSDGGVCHDSHGHDPTRSTRVDADCQTRTCLLKSRSTKMMSLLSTKMGGRKTGLLLDGFRRRSCR
jgi:hypothetical protein